MARVRKIIISCLLAFVAALAWSAPAPASPVLEPSSSSVEYGTAEVHGGSFPQQGVTFYDQSLIETTVESVTLKGPDAADFAKPVDNCSGATVEPTFSCDVQVRFQPTSAGAKSATLELVESFGTVEVQLSGTGTTGTLPGNPLSFSATRVGENRTEQVTIGNSTAGTHISAVEIVGADASSFSIAYGNCVENTLPQNNSCGVGVRFEPFSAGEKTAELLITSDAGNNPLAIPLSGTAVNGPALSVSPRQALLGDVLIGSSATQTFTISNTGDYPLGVQGAFVVSGTPLMFPIVSDACSSHFVEPGASCTITAEFPPTTVGPKTASIILITNSSSGVSAVGMEGIGVGSGVASTSGAIPAISGAAPAPALIRVAPPAVALPRLVSLPNYPAGRSVNARMLALCPASATRCAVRSTLTTILAFSARHRRARGSKVLLGSTVMTLHGGQTAQVYGLLSRSGAALLKRRHTLRASLIVVMTTPGSPAVSRSRTLTIRAKTPTR